MVSGPIAPKTWGKPFWSRSRRNEENHVRAESGMTASMPLSTAEWRTWRARPLSWLWARAVPTSQATSSTDTTLTTPPPKESTSRTGSQVMRRRTAMPTAVATS